MTGETSLTFAPGAKAACAKGSLVVLIDRPLTDPVALSTWTLLDEGQGADLVVGTFLSHGLADAPDFGLVEVGSDGGARVVVRGRATARGAAIGRRAAAAGGGAARGVAAAPASSSPPSSVTSKLWPSTLTR